jgi:hypothetical protein
MADFVLELIRTGAFFRGVLAFMVTLALLFLLINQLPIPDQFALILGLVYGYFFASDTPHQVASVHAQTLGNRKDP